MMNYGFSLRQVYYGSKSDFKLGMQTSVLLIPKTNAQLAGRQDSVAVRWNRFHAPGDEFQGDVAHSWWVKRNHHAGLSLS